MKPGKKTHGFFLKCSNFSRPCELMLTKGSSPDMKSTRNGEYERTILLFSSPNVTLPEPRSKTLRLESKNKTLSSGIHRDITKSYRSLMILYMDFKPKLLVKLLKDSCFVISLTLNICIDLYRIFIG